MRRWLFGLVLSIASAGAAGAQAPILDPYEGQRGEEAPPSEPRPAQPVLDPFAPADDASPDAGENPFVEVPPEVPVIDPSCVPACRAGFTCVSGQCVSACNPACPADHVCTSDGACVPEAMLAPPPAMCSPACPAGTVCSPAGTCVPVGAAYAPPSARPIVPTFDRRYAQKASSRGVLSFVSAGLVYALGFAAAAFRLQDETCTFCDRSALPEAALGGVGLLFTAIMGPIASGGGRAGRRGGGRGVGVARALAWVTYVGTLVGGIATLALAATERDVPSGLLFGLAASGGTTFVLFGVDGIIAGKQARAAANEAQRNLAPAISLWRESITEQPRPAFGLRLSF